MEFLLFSFELDDNEWFSFVAGLDLEWPEFDILLDSGVSELSTDETFDIEHGVLGVSSGLVSGSFSNLSFLFGEGNI